MFDSQNNASNVGGDGTSSRPAQPGRPAPRRHVELADVRAEIGDCRRCQLCETRTKLVFGVGDPHARVMFIGEGPGKNEDLQGEPFVGAAGHKLDELLAEAGLKRGEVYIANILKCRPPGNRDPQPDEISACTPFLRDQVRAVNPQVIVTLGKYATQFVLHTDRGITSLRGQVYQTGRFLVLPIFHPAAALYDPSKDEMLHYDFSVLRMTLDRFPRDAWDASFSALGTSKGAGSGSGSDAGRGGEGGTR
jgi:uracil-DNA glycosylase family 4